MYSHTGIKSFNSIGMWGVSIFFILSGFVLVLNYYGTDRIKHTSFADNFKFAFHHIKRLYLLHIVCTLAMLIFSCVGKTKDSLKMILLKLLLNLLFLQEWIPLGNYPTAKSINAVAWFLCTTIFAYFVFPWVIKRMNKKYSVKQAKISSILCIFTMFMIGILASRVPALPSTFEQETIWTYQWTHWLVYDFPLSRLLDVLLGCNLGYLFLKADKDKLSVVKIHGLELITIAGIAVAWYVSHIYKTVAGLGEQVIYSTPETWWTEVLVFVPSSCLLIYLFALEKGYLSKILTNRFTLYLAKLSPYGFLIHYVVFRYLSSVIAYLPIENIETFSYYYIGIIKGTIGVILSVFATEIWIRFYRYMFSRMHYFSTKR